MSAPSPDPVHVRRRWRRPAAIAAALAPAVVACGGPVPLSYYSMSSASMEPTLKEGDLFTVDTLKGSCGHTHPVPGQVIVFRRADSIYVARAVAGPGQTVGVTAGRLVIDGKPVAVAPAGVAQVEMFGGQSEPAAVVRETLANGRTYLTQDLGPDGELDNQPPVTVKGGWFVMGDNRDNAADSRVNGPVPEANICGAAVGILFAKDKRRAEL